MFLLGCGTHVGPPRQAHPRRYAANLQHCLLFQGCTCFQEWALGRLVFTSNLLSSITARACFTSVTASVGSDDSEFLALEDLGEYRSDSLQSLRNKRRQSRLSKQPARTDQRGARIPSTSFSRRRSQLDGAQTSHCQPIVCLSGASVSLLFDVASKTQAAPADRPWEGARRPPHPFVNGETPSVRLTVSVE